MDSKWDNYFHTICESVSTKSPCLSRKIGAILVRDKSIISTGFNGPARGIPHCGHERFMKDSVLSTFINKSINILPNKKEIIESNCLVVF